MRRIEGGPEPNEFTQWRAGSQNDINYSYRLIPSSIKEIIKSSLVRGQRGLCAYTGIGIRSGGCHVEHLRPQAHCLPGEDVDYANMAACYPGPDGGHVPFGAVRKGDWPSRDEWHLFVSPRSEDCEARFSFNLRGEISSNSDDVAASTTIERLGLNHARLVALRRVAIDETLKRLGGRPASLDLQAARRRLAGLERAEATGGPLEPFCFALKQALQRHIKRIEASRAAKRRRGR